MWKLETKELFAYCPFPFSPGHPHAKPSCGSNLLNPVVCEHRPCSVLAFEEKFSKVYVSAHPGKRGPPSGWSLWLIRQKSLVRIRKFRKLSVSLYLQTSESEQIHLLRICSTQSPHQCLEHVPGKHVKSCLWLLHYYQVPELIENTSNKLANTLVPDNKDY